MFSKKHRITYRITFYYSFESDHKIFKLQNYDRKILSFYTQNHLLPDSTINYTALHILLAKIFRSWLRCIEDNCRRHVRVYISSRVPFFPTRNDAAEFCASRFVIIVRPYRAVTAGSNSFVSLGHGVAPRYRDAGEFRLDDFARGHAARMESSIRPSL